MKKIGIAGFGHIGRYLYERLHENRDISVAAVWEPVKDKTASLDSWIICEDLDDLGSRPLDLIVEAAHADVVQDLWHRCTSGADLMIASMTCLADPEFRRRIEDEAVAGGRKVYLPHGAILALDGLRDGKEMLDSVFITTTKAPQHLGMPDRNITEPQVVFDGTTREACALFPRNVNVHAAVALAGLGFEKTRSKVIADPHTTKMRHVIHVSGRGLNWKLEVESFAAGQVTGSYTPESLYQSIVNILTRNAGFCIV